MAGAVRAVVTIAADEVTPVAVGVTEVGVSEQDEPAGTPVQVKATDELKPFNPFTVTVTLAVPPAATLTVVGDAATEKSGVVDPPVPLSVAVCGLLASLSETLSVAVADPVEVGVNVTLMVQLAPAARDDEQVFVWAKGEVPAGVMLTAIPLISTALLFFSVTVFAALVVLTP